MVEYTIVLVFGVLALTTGPGGDVMLELLQTVKKNYQGYSFGISMSEAPDFDTPADLRSYLRDNDVADDRIDRLAVNTSDLYDELEPYNRDPNQQLRTLGKTKEAKVRWFESWDGVKNKVSELGEALASSLGL